MSTLTWLHLSDLHACTPKFGWDAGRVLETLVADLERLQREHGLRPDLIFFTGDAAWGEIGTEGEKTIAGQLGYFAKFLEEVRTVFVPEVELENVFLVPGNHDVNRKKVARSETFWLGQQEQLEPVRELIHEAGLDWRRYMERLGNYRIFLERHGFDHLLDDPERLIYATVRSVGGLRVGIAGLNSAWSCCQDKERGGLWMAGKWQQGVLRPKLREADFSIALMHHPPDWLVEYENPDFGRGLEQDFRFLLHGHEHRAWVQPGAGGYTVLAAAACYERSEGEHNGYNVVRLDPEAGRGEVWLRRFEAGGGDWIPCIIAGRTDDRGVWQLRPEWLVQLRAEEAVESPENGRPEALRVFLCHATEDKPAVRALYQELKDAGVSAWLDEEDLLPGQDWRLEISRAIRTSHAFIVCLSGTSTTKEGFVHKEIRSALDMADEKPEDAIFVIPLRLEECRVPERLSRLHYVDLFDERGVSRLLKALQHRANELGIAISPTTAEAGDVTGPGHRDSGQPLATNQVLTGAAVIQVEDSTQRERAHEKDGTMLVYVPGGDFTLGSDDISDAERPIHRVRLSPFRIAEYPVTNEQYRRYLEADSNQRKPEFWDDKELNQPRQPVVGVSWEEAVAYCRWAGLELPSEAQWEAAARGQDQRRYPWGNAEPTASHANFDGIEGKTTPLGSYPGGAGPYGTLDQAGNVWEWCADIWDASAYQGREGRLDPVATTGDAAVRVLRGGSWASQPRDLAAAYRNWDRAGNRCGDFGFRGLLRVGPEP